MEGLELSFEQLYFKKNLTQNCSLIHTDICQELSKIRKIRVTSKKCIVVGPPGEGIFKM